MDSRGNPSQVESSLEDLLSAPPPEVSPDLGDRIMAAAESRGIWASMGRPRGAGRWLQATAAAAAVVAVLAGAAAGWATLEGQRRTEVVPSPPSMGDEWFPGDAFDAGAGDAETDWILGSPTGPESTT